MVPCCAYNKFQSFDIAYNLSLYLFPALALTFPTLISPNTHTHTLDSSLILNILYFPKYPFTFTHAVPFAWNILYPAPARPQPPPPDLGFSFWQTTHFLGRSPESSPTSSCSTLTACTRTSSTTGSSEHQSFVSPSLVCEHRNQASHYCSPSPSTMLDQS